MTNAQINQIIEELSYDGVTQYDTNTNTFKFVCSYTEEVTLIKPEFYTNDNGTKGAELIGFRNGHSFPITYVEFK